MLKILSLENFKPFGKRQTAEFKPITLVYGPNSSGKSSLIQSLLLLEQSLRPNASGNLVPRGELVDLGSFQSLIHGHQSDRSLGLEVTFTVSDDFGHPGMYSRAVKEGEEITVGLTYSRGELPSAGSYLPAILQKVSYKIDCYPGTIQFARAQRQRRVESRTDAMHMIDDNTVFFKFLDEKSVEYAANYIRRVNPNFDRQDFHSMGSAGLSEHRIDKWESQLEFIHDQLKESRQEASILRKKLESQNFRPATIKKHKQTLSEFKRKKDHLTALSGELKHKIKLHNLRSGNEAEDNNGKSPKQTLEHKLKRAVLVSEIIPLSERVVLDETDRVEGADFRFRHNFELFSMALFDELRSVRYLGPLRSYPERHYLVSGESVKSVGKTGENTPHLLYEHKEKIRQDVNRWLEQFDIPYELDIDLKGDDEVIGDILTISLRDVRTDIRVSPSDVGFGIGQLLPIIVEGVFSQGNIVCVEQPEIHLHPKLQASLADFFIDTSANLSKSLSDGPTKKRPWSRRREGLPKTNQWIVETHSEALMLRLQRRIREGAIAAEDVSVLYVEPAKNGGRIISLPLDAHGNFEKEWPEGFFEESFNEMIG